MSNFGVRFLLTNGLWHDILNLRKVVERIYAIIFIFLIIIIYNLINLNLYNKSIRKNLINKTSIFSKNTYVNSYKEKTQQRLSNLGNPYNINFTKYIVIKFIISPLFFIIAYLNYQNVLVATLLFLSTFYSLNLLIFIFQKEENIKIINEIKNLNLNLILYLSCYAPLKTALKESIKSLSYSRIVDAFNRFAFVYEANGYNLSKASQQIEEKFNSYELRMFINLLKQGEKEGKLIENLERFDETLELSYFKYLKRQGDKQLLYVIMGCMISLGSMSIVVIYPMIIDIINNLQKIFV